MSPETSLARARWQFTKHLDIRVVRFGAEALVFNPLSGETHLLNETAAHVVDSLRRGLGDVAALAAELTAALDPHAAPEAYVAQIAGLLEELESLGLVCREPSAALEMDSRLRGNDGIDRSVPGSGRC